MKKAYKKRVGDMGQKLTPQPEEMKPTATTYEEKSNEEVNQGICDDFDLRKAIIYAEILKPKFDE